jgi:GNAT superfamily N-acetyltransferase
MTMADGIAIFDEGAPGRVESKAGQQVVIRPAEGAADVQTVRGLMREYGEHLAHLAEGPTGAASICLGGYEEELAGLPEPYVAPGGVWLAMVDGEAAGCAALKRLCVGAAAAEAGRDAGGMALELKRLWVRDGFRGLRLGRRLMQAVIDHARAAGAAAIYLDTVPAAMPEANRLYTAMEFAPVERYNENWVADIAFFRLGLDAAD